MGSNDRTIFNGTGRKVIFRTKTRDIEVPAKGSTNLNASEFGVLSASNMYKALSNRGQISTKPFKQEVPVPLEKEVPPELKSDLTSFQKGSEQTVTVESPGLNPVDEDEPKTENKKSPKGKGK